MTPFRSLLLLAFLSCFSLYGQRANDSLLQVLARQSDDDTAKVITLYKLCAGYMNGDVVKAMDYARQAKALAERLGYKRGLARAYNNMGLVYENMGDYEKASECFFASLRIREEAGEKAGLGKVYNNIGLVFDIQGNYDKAWTYYSKSLELAVQQKDELGIANCYLNLGVVLSEKDRTDSALWYYRKAAAIFQRNEMLADLGNVLSDFGVIYEDAKMYDSARIYYDSALAVRKRADATYDMINSYNNLGSFYFSTGDTARSREYLLKSVELARQLDVLPGLKVAYENLAELEAQRGNYKQALEYQRLFMQVKDSLFTTESAKEIGMQEMKYEVEKKEKEEELRRKAKFVQQLIIVVSLVVILLVVSVFSFFLVKRIRMIRLQKTVIEEKNKEITDSINYARRLQDAILPPEKYWRRHFPESFIFYRPKDIVAGDFYWMEALQMESQNAEAGNAMLRTSHAILFAAADCTGHGVPGAMVSVVCSNALNRAVKEFRLNDPGKILDKVTELVLETFEKSEESVKDGMDISLCLLSADRRSLYFSGANNSLWIVRNQEMIVVEADAQPVGKFDHLKPFTTHHVALQSGDCIFLATDGYADQFGGEKGKKFKTANLKKLLLANADRTMAEQEQVVQLTFERWKGRHEQVDDVCVIGVRV